MHHVTGVGNDGVLAVGDRFIAQLLIGSLSLAAFLAVDDQHRTGDPAEELQSLSHIERLGRRGSMQRIEFPHPFALGVLFHAGPGQIQRKIRAQPWIGLLQLACTRRDAGVLAKVMAAAVLRLVDPLLHSFGSIGEIHAGGAHAFDQHQVRYALRKRSGVEERDRFRPSNGR